MCTLVPLVSLTSPCCPVKIAIQNDCSFERTFKVYIQNGLAYDLCPFLRFTIGPFIEKGHCDVALEDFVSKKAILLGYRLINDKSGLYEAVFRYNPPLKACTTDIVRIECFEENGVTEIITEPLLLRPCIECLLIDFNCDTQSTLSSAGQIALRNKFSSLGGLGCCLPICGDIVQIIFDC